MIVNLEAYVGINEAHTDGALETQKAAPKARPSSEMYFAGFVIK